MAQGMTGRPGLLRNRRGAVAIIFALIAPVLIGFVALAVEVGLWYMIKARMQGVADAAAMAGDRELAAATGKLAAAVTLEGTLNNCNTSENCTLNTPTTFRTASSPNTDNGVQVTAQTTITPLLAALVMSTNPNGTITISATGRAAFTSQDSGGTVGCVLGLDNNAAYTVTLNNNAKINCPVMSNSNCQGPGSATCTLDATTYGSYPGCSPSIDDQCGAGINDNDISSLYLANNARINSSGAAAGLIKLDNNAKITTKITNATLATDPYAAITVTAPTATAAPTIAGGNGSSSAKAIDISIAANTCSTAALTYSNNLYLQIHPGCYNGLNVANNIWITLYPGTYYFKTQFSVGNNASVIGTSGTTLVFVGSGAASYAITISNNATLSITAPTTGPYAGLALLGDPNGLATKVQSFSNNATLSIIGAIYFRTQILDMENNAISGANSCLQLIARRVLLSNNATLGTNCTGIGTTPFMVGQHVTPIIELVE